MREIWGIIFDLDGVIADSHALHQAAWSVLLAEAGQITNDAELGSIIREGRTRAEILETLLPASSAEERAIWSLRKESLFAAAMAHQDPVPGVVDWICSLHATGVPLAVATSASRRRALDTLTRFAIAPCFRAVVAADDVSAGKPDPQLFLAAARALNMKAADLLVVEDSKAGLLAASAASMRSLWYRPDQVYVTGPEDLSPEFAISAFTPEQLRPITALLRAPVLATETA